MILQEAISSRSSSISAFVSAVSINGTFSKLLPALVKFAIQAFVPMSPNSSLFPISNAFECPQRFLDHDWSLAWRVLTAQCSLLESQFPSALSWASRSCAPLRKYCGGHETFNFAWAKQRLCYSLFAPRMC